MRPYGPLEVSPAAGVLNYGQGLFEGMKAYRTVAGRVVLFRPDQACLLLAALLTATLTVPQNAERNAEGAVRMSMPPVPKGKAPAAAVATRSTAVDACTEQSCSLTP